MPLSYTLTAAKALDAEYESLPPGDPQKLDLAAAAQDLARFLCSAGWVAACGQDGCQTCVFDEDQPQRSAEPIPWDDQD